MIFGAALETRPIWLSFYHNMLKDDGNVIATSKDDEDTLIGGLTSDFAREKNVTVFAEGTCIFILKKDMGETFMKAHSKKHETQKLVDVKIFLERLNSGTVKNILFMHPWTGCDPTIFMRLITKTDGQVLVICFDIDKVDATPEVIGKAAVKLCIKTSGMCYKSFHGCLRIISPADRKLYYIFLYNAFISIYR